MNNNTNNLNEMLLNNQLILPKNIETNISFHLNNSIHLNNHISFIVDKSSKIILSYGFNYYLNFMGLQSAFVPLQTHNYSLGLGVAKHF